MRFSVVTIFPEMIAHFLEFGLINRAIKKGLVAVDVYDLRDFTEDKHRKVDDKPFGGGPGMVMMPGPWFNVVSHIKNQRPGRVILFSAYADCLKQEKLKQLSEETHLILLCCRYEGVDQRVIDHLVDEEISIGEFVMMGGEVAAEALLEGISRMIPGVVGNWESVKSDSFYQEDQLAYPQYTQPRNFRGFNVPEVLLLGNHKEIIEWQKKNRKKR